jgi:hypothetical protein
MLDKQQDSLTGPVIKNRESAPFIVLQSHLKRKRAAIATLCRTLM